MAYVRSVTRVGRQLMLAYSDGTRELVQPQGQGSWIAKLRQENNPSGGSGGIGGAGVYITEEMVRAGATAIGSPESAMVDTCANIASAMNEAIKKKCGDRFIGKKSRACLVGECAQETDWFKTYKEYAGSATTGDNYFGRGMIQLTWRGNYAGFGEWWGIDAVGNPDLLLETANAAATGPYYFTQRAWAGKDLCQWADDHDGDVTGDWTPISAAINRGNPWGGTPYGNTNRNAAINAVLKVTPDVNTGGAGAAVDKMLSWQGTLFYSQAASVRNNTPDSGGGDCSSTVIAAYVKSGTKTVEEMGGNAGAIGYTGTLGHAGSYICNNAAAAEGQMQPGDLILISWGGGGWPWDHVEMYIGDGKICGHGGPGLGPTVKPLNQWNVGTNEVRRYV